MGKLLHKVIQGIRLPSRLFTRFSNSRASSGNWLYLKLRRNNYKAAKLRSPSENTDHELPANLMNIEQNTYYYSYSEDEQGSLGHDDDTSIGRESRRRRGAYGDADSCDDRYFLQQQQQVDGNLQDTANGEHDVQHRGQEEPPCLIFKRKSLVLGENDDDDDDDDQFNSNEYGNDKLRCRMKRQKTAMNVRCEQLPECISDIVGEGSAIVQYSSCPETYLAFWESMVGMIVSNDQLYWDVGRLESLLLCYLTLNEPHLYSTICTSFLQAFKDVKFTLGS